MKMVIIIHNVGTFLRKSATGHLMAVLIILGAVLALSNLELFSDADALLGWRGQQWYHVPMSWCSITGSPAAQAPNTDALINDRNLRASSLILQSQIGVSLSSGLNQYGGRQFLGVPLTYPELSDNFLGSGSSQGGDILDPAINRAEFDSTILNCENAWVRQTIQPFSGIFGPRPWVSSPVNGLTAVNIGQFHNGAGAYAYNMGTPPVFGQLLGVAACDTLPPRNSLFSLFYEMFFTALRLTCFSGNLLILDNTFLPSDPNQLVLSHEASHDLGLPHTAPGPASNGALMAAFVQDNDGDGTWDNTMLNAAETRLARSHAGFSPGVQFDPVNKLIPTDVVGAFVIDDIKNFKTDNSEDLAKVRVDLDTKADKVLFGQQVYGLFTNKTHPLEFWTLLDKDNNINTTVADKNQLLKIGIPKDVEFQGIDFVIKAEVNGFNDTNSTAWTIKNGDLVQLESNASGSATSRSIASPIIKPVSSTPLNITWSAPRTPIHDTVLVGIPNSVIRLSLNLPFKLQSIITTTNEADNSTKILDSLEDNNTGFILQHPSVYSHCFPQQSNANPGDIVPITLQGFPNSSVIRGFFDVSEVLNQQITNGTDSVVKFTIPKDGNSGFHQLTLLSDKAGISATCGIDIK